MAKHSATRQKLKDAKETGEGERPKHKGLKPTDAKPTQHEVKLTM